MHAICTRATATTKFELTTSKATEPNLQHKITLIAATQDILHFSWPHYWALNCATFFRFFWLLMCKNKL